MKTIYIILVLFLPLILLGQSEEELKFQEQETDTAARIFLITEYKENSIYLRWAPNNYKSWLRGNISGYMLYKYTIDSDSNLPDPTSVDSFIIRPWSYEKLSTESESISDTILAMGECIHGALRSDNADKFGAYAREVSNRYNVAIFLADLNFKAAESGALGFRDEDVEEGKKYFYHVTIKDSTDNTLSAYSRAMTEVEKRPRPEFSYAHQKDSLILLQWDKEFYSEFYTSYRIEVSDDNTTFRTLNSTPIVGGESRDYPSNLISYSVMVDNYIPRFYRLRGRSAFGELSPPSEAIRLMAKDRTPCDVPQNITINTDTETGSVELGWDNVKCLDITGYQVYYDTIPNGRFNAVSQIFRKSEFAYNIDNTHSHNYFRVAVIDTAGNKNMSSAIYAPFRDSLPPSTPTQLQGIIDTNGIVTLSWKAPPEKDVYKYYIHRANSDRHIFTVVNPEGALDTFCYDTITLKTLTEHIYYKITAMDYYGHMSPVSDWIELERPDTIPPFPPYVMDYQQDPQGITINWGPSASKDAEQYLLFKKINDSSWHRISDFSKDQTLVFIDSGVEYGNHYSYKLITRDNGNLLSNDHATISMKYVDRRIPKTVEILSCELIDDSIHLKWQTGDSVSNSQIIIYRASENGNFYILDRVEDSSHYIDRSVNPDKLYTYALKRQWSNGRKSQLSSKITASK